MSNPKNCKNLATHLGNQPCTKIALGTDFNSREREEIGGTEGGKEGGSRKQSDPRCIITISMMASDHKHLYHTVRSNNSESIT